MRISDWSSDVCSSDLRETVPRFGQRRIVCDHRYLPMGERLGHRQAPSLIVAGIDGERARPVQCRQFAVGRIVNPYAMCLERRVALEARKYLIVAPAPSAGADQQRKDRKSVV